MDFVFLAFEGRAKRSVIERLVEFGIPFVDVGMGLYAEGALGGILRATTITPERSSHAATRISSGSVANDPYGQNIQIAELNALNAALAIIKWKKLLGFYRERLSCDQLATARRRTVNAIRLSLSRIRARLRECVRHRLAIGEARS